MAGMRDRLIHDYFGVDYDIVWDAVSQKIPPLRQGAPIAFEQSPNFEAADVDVPDTITDFLEADIVSGTESIECRVLQA
jgi:hypothetical protein